MTQRVLVFALFLGVVGMPATTSAQPVKANAPIKIGVVKHFFNDMPSAIIDIAVEPFGDVMKAAVGVEGQLMVKDGPFEVAQKLEKNELDVGVFHGHEFAWVQKKHPKLIPIVVAMNKYREVKAYVIVHQNSPAKKMADLSGKNFDLPLGTKEHCLVYLNTKCADNAQANVKTFFKQVARSNSGIAGLDNVARGKVDAVLVDTLTLEFYKQEKGPVFTKHLRVLEESAQFPPPVVVYKEGAIDAATLKKFRTGLEDANKAAAGQSLLQLWQIASFEALPGDYSQSLAYTLKTYPLPAAAGKVEMME